MLEFLILLSAEWHADLFCFGADLAREAATDPDIDVAQGVERHRVWLSVMMAEFGLVGAPWGLTPATNHPECNHWPCTCEAWTV